MFSKSGKYAVRAILYIAINANSKKKISPREIAKGIQVPAAYLAKILQLLTKRNLVSGTRGRHGGFYLEEGQRTNTLLAVIEAIDGLSVLEECTLGLSTCSDEHPCPFHATTATFRTSLMLELSSQSIEDLCVDIKNGSVSIDNY